MSAPTTTTMKLMMMIVVVVVTTTTTMMVGAIKCFKCDAENDNCNNPTLGQPGVTSCESKYCIKSTATIVGVSATERMCAESVKIESGCLHDSISGASTHVCVCSDVNYCNGTSGRKYSASILMGLLVATLAFLLTSLSSSGASG